MTASTRRNTSLSLAAVGDVTDDQLKSLGQSGMAGGKIVINDGFIALALQGKGGMAANVTRSSND